MSAGGERPARKSVAPGKELPRASVAAGRKSVGGQSIRDVQRQQAAQIVHMRDVQIADLEQELADVKQQLEAANAEVQQRLYECADKSKILKQTEVTLEQTRRALARAEVGSAHEADASLAAENRKLEAENRRLRDDVMRLQNRAEQSEAAGKRALHEAKTLAGKLEGATQQLKTERDSRAASTEDLINSLAGAEVEREQAAEAQEAAEERAERAERELLIVSNLHTADREELRRLRLATKAKDAEYDHLQKLVQDSLTACDSMEQTSADSFRVHEELAQLRVLNEDLAKQVEERAVEADTLRQSEARAVKELERCKAVHAQFKETVSGMQQQQVSAQEEREEFRNQVSRAEVERDQMQLRTTTLEMELKEARGRAAAVEEVRAKLQATLHDAMGQNAELKAKVAVAGVGGDEDLRRRLQTAEERAARLENAREDCLASFERREIDITELKDQNYVLQHNVKSQAAVAEKCRKRLKDKDSQLQTLRSENKTLGVKYNELVSQSNEELERISALANEYRDEHETIRLSLLRKRCAACGGSLEGGPQTAAPAAATTGARAAKKRTRQPAEDADGEMAAELGVEAPPVRRQRVHSPKLSDHAPTVPRSKDLESKVMKYLRARTAETARVSMKELRIQLEQQYGWDLQDKKTELKDIVSDQLSAVAAAAPAKTSVEDMSYKELRALAKDKGVSTKGKMDELRQRLAAL